MTVEKFKVHAKAKVGVHSSSPTITFPLIIPCYAPARTFIRTTEHDQKFASIFMVAAVRTGIVKYLSYLNDHCVLNKIFINNKTQYL